jgi:hypothetical protein
MFSQPPPQFARTPTPIHAPCAQHPFAPPWSLPGKRPFRSMGTVLQTQPAVRSKPGQKPISDRPAHAPPTANCRYRFNVGHHRLYQFASLAKYRRVFPWHSAPKLVRPHHCQRSYGRDCQQSYGTVPPCLSTMTAEISQARRPVTTAKRIAQ